MRLAGLQVGSTVFCRKNGTPFYARVLDLDAEFMGARFVEVQPLTPGVTYRRLRPTQILRKVSEREAVPV